MVMDCDLCRQTGGELVQRAPTWRVIRVADPDFPAFYRVVWQTHVAEFSDLSAAERRECMEVVTRVEQALRQTLRPTKINLASLGNMVAHLHWHVIARFDWDSHFPQPVWGTRQRSLDGLMAVHRLEVSLTELDQAVRHSLSGLSPE